jgi:hypothetical protein
MNLEKLKKSLLQQKQLQKRKKMYKKNTNYNPGTSIGRHHAPSVAPVWNSEASKWEYSGGETPQTMSTAPVANPQAIGAHHAPSVAPTFNTATNRWEGEESSPYMQTTPISPQYPLPQEAYEDSILPQESGPGPWASGYVPYGDEDEEERLKFGQTGYLRQQMTDDKGLFRGGREGRMFGRARDWWEDNVKGGGDGSNREDGLVVADDFEGYDSQRNVNNEYRNDVEKWQKFKDELYDSQKKNEW